MSTLSHRWINAPLRQDRTRALADHPLPPPLLTADPVDAHRRLRGPYTAAGTILRELVTDALARCPELVHAHDLEILSVTPELREVVQASRETLTSLAVPAERTRFYSRLRTLRLAHGLSEFLRDYLRATGGGPRSLVVENADAADITDQELLSVLVRRIDPGLLTLVVCTSADPRDVLTEALQQHTERFDAVSAAAPADTDGNDDGATTAALAARYVASDCTSDEDELRTAYARLDPDQRAALHDERAADLEARGEPSLRLGAIAHHREHGSDPGGSGAAALRFALDYCIDMGFYEATIDLGARGRAVIDWAQQPEMWWMYTTKMTTSLAALGRAAEAEALYHEARASTVDPQVHLQAAYATSMLYTRHHEDDHKDHLRAKGWINEAIAISSLLPDHKERIFNTVFNQNGLALIEVHLRNLPEALRLVTEGLARLDAELGPDEHQLHRSVLRYNRAQVYAGLGRLEEALSDYDAVIARDPNYAEYYFDRAALLRRLGRDEPALRDLERAMRLSPPYPEVYYNRGDLRLEHGDVAGALADFDYVLELEPTYVDAYINRSGLLCELGELDAARRDVTAGLELAPDNPHLLSVQGRLEMEAGHTGAARAAFTAALAADPTLAAAWANRGVLAFETGDVEGAVADLSAALDIDDDPAVRANRATAFEALGRWTDAVADLTLVIGTAPADTEAPSGRSDTVDDGDDTADADLLLRRGACLLRLGDEDAARADLSACLRLDPDLADQVAQLMPTAVDKVNAVDAPNPT